MEPTGELESAKESEIELNMETEATMKNKSTKKTESGGNRKKQIRFSDEDDVRLLKEVLAQDTFSKKRAWPSVADAITDEHFKVDARRCRERTELLIAKFRKDTAESLKQSGIDEEFGEKEALLTEIIEFLDEKQAATSKAKETKENEAKAAENIRKRAMEGMKYEEDASSKPSANKKMTVMDYLKEKQEKDFELKQKEIELKREELKLAKEKFELEKDERKAAVRTQQKQTEMLMTLIQKMH